MGQLKILLEKIFLIWFLLVLGNFLNFKILFVHYYNSFFSYNLFNLHDYLFIFDLNFLSLTFSLIKQIFFLSYK